MPNGKTLLNEERAQLDVLRSDALAQKIALRTAARRIGCDDKIAQNYLKAPGCYGKRIEENGSQ